MPCSLVCIFSFLHLNVGVAVDDFDIDKQKSLVASSSNTTYYTNDLFWVFVYPTVVSIGSLTRD